jgi:hypothetical protein
VLGDGLALAGVEPAEHVAAELLADVTAALDGVTPISSSTSRSERSAYQVRLLTVPSGSPVCSEISRIVRPRNWAMRTIWRCSGVSRSSAAATCQPSIACSSVVPPSISAAASCCGSPGRTAARRRVSMIALRAIW